MKKQLFLLLLISLIATGVVAQVALVRPARKKQPALNAYYLSLGDITNGMTFSYDRNWPLGIKNVKLNTRIGFGGGTRQVKNSDSEYYENALLFGAGMVMGKKWALQQELTFLHESGINEAIANMCLGLGLRVQGNGFGGMTKIMLLYLPDYKYDSHWGVSVGAGLRF